MMNKQEVLKQLKSIEANDKQTQALSIAIGAMENLHVRKCVVCGEIFTTNSVRKHCSIPCKGKMRYNVFE